MSEKIDVVEIFGANVFNDAVMKERLPKKVYEKLRKVIDEGAELTSDIADVVANAMKDWAVEKGATHYTHWFQPLTGVTAEKHDSFISAANAEGNRMHLHSHQVDLELHLKQEVILHGTVLHRRLLRKMQQVLFFVFLQHSVHIQVKRLTRRHHFLDLCRQ